MSVKKYELVKDDYIEIKGKKLFRIVALKSFLTVEAGDLGGYIESEQNLYQSGNAWVYDNARVYDNALIYGNARVYDNALIYGNAWVSGDALVYDNARVSGDARVCDNALVSGDAEIMWISKVGSELATLTVFKTKDGYNITRGCFIGTIDEFKAKVSEKDNSDESKKEYELLIPLIEYRFNKYL